MKRRLEIYHDLCTPCLRIVGQHTYASVCMQCFVEINISNRDTTTPHVSRKKLLLLNFN